MNEFSRRHSNALDLLKFFEANPNRWIGWRRLARIAGALAWRTRVSDVRKIAQDRGGDVQWNKSVKDSKYRYLVHRPIGPDASVYREKQLPF